MFQILLTPKNVDPSIPVPVDLFRTPLHAAAINGDEFMCQALLLRGADPTLRDKVPPTPGNNNSVY